MTDKKNENGNFELIAGERRLKAAMKAGLRRVPCVVHSVLLRKNYRELSIDVQLIDGK